MSCTELFGFYKNGEAYNYADISNAFRSGMAIWIYLEEKYLPPYLPEYARKIGVKTAEEYKHRIGHKSSRCTAIMEHDAMKEIWNLAYDNNVSETDKICLYTTFDRCLVKKEDIPQVIKAFREFEGETSLKEQADVLERMFADENCIAVGWNQTSVNSESWICTGGYDEDEDEYLPYNCLSGKNHYWLFDELNKECEKNG